MPIRLTLRRDQTFGLLNSILIHNMPLLSLIWIYLILFASMSISVCFWHESVIRNQKLRRESPLQMAAWPSHFPTYDKFDPLGERIGKSPTIHPYWWIRLGAGCITIFMCSAAVDPLSCLGSRTRGHRPAMGHRWTALEGAEYGSYRTAQHKKDRAVIADNAPMTQRIQHIFFQNDLGHASLIVQDSCSGSRFDVLSLLLSQTSGLLWSMKEHGLLVLATWTKCVTQINGSVFAPWDSRRQLAASKKQISNEK